MYVCDNIYVITYLNPQTTSFAHVLFHFSHENFKMVDNGRN